MLRRLSRATPVRHFAADSSNEGASGSSAGPPLHSRPGRSARDDPRLDIRKITRQATVARRGEAPSTPAALRASLRDQEIASKRLFDFVKQQATIVENLANASKIAEEQAASEARDNELAIELAGGRMTFQQRVNRARRTLPDDEKFQIFPRSETAEQLVQPRQQFIADQLEKVRAVQQTQKSYCRICAASFNKPPRDAIHPESIHPLNAPLLTRFLTGFGTVKGRRFTKLCAKHQRKMDHAIRRARHMGVISLKNNDFTLYSPFADTIIERNDNGDWQAHRNEETSVQMNSEERDLEQLALEGADDINVYFTDTDEFEEQDVDELDDQDEFAMALGMADEDSFDAREAEKEKRRRRIEAKEREKEARRK